MKIITTTTYLTVLAAITMCTAGARLAKEQSVGVNINAEKIKYYIDFANGNDANDGKGELKAWKSLDKVNNTTFQPGEVLLFKRGGSWIGQLYPKGSGANGNPIIIDAYGVGEKPIIDANGIFGPKESGTIFLFNQEYWEINNLAVKNTASTDAERSGIRVMARDYGTINHIYIKNCDVFDIKGMRFWETDPVFGDRICYRTGGINFFCLRKSGEKETKMNHILVEGNTITNCSSGIVAVYYPNFTNDYPNYNIDPAFRSTNVVVKNNKILNTKTDGIVIVWVNNSLVQNNVVDGHSTDGKGACGIWAGRANKGIFRGNTIANGGKIWDSQAIDLDAFTRNFVIERNYTYNNQHGFIGFLEVGEYSNDHIIRNNISVNDAERLIFVMGYDKGKGQVKNIKIYNNTFISDKKTYITAYRDTFESDLKIFNNVFHLNNCLGFDKNLSPEYKHKEITFTYQNNGYFGFAITPKDSGKVIGMPGFIDVTKQYNQLDGYKLKKGSPLIGAGAIIENAGADYWGNTIPTNKRPNIGAFNGNIK